MTSRPTRLARGRSLIGLLLLLLALPLDAQRTGRPTRASSPADSEPRIVGPPQLDFGAVRMDAGEVRTFLVQNTGSTRLVLAGFDLAGPDAASFEVLTPPHPSRTTSLGLLSLLFESFQRRCLSHRSCQPR